MQKITPFLWFESKAEEAVDFYVSMFSQAPGKTKEDSKIVKITHYDEAGAKASEMPEGSVMTVAFKLAGQDFVAINGGPYFKFSGAVSFVVNCETQEEVDYFWEKLSMDGGEKGQCGWINHDKFGVTWQVVPTVLEKLINDPDPKKSQAVMEAMLKMTKLEIRDLQKAYEQA
jgi:predicted 3-demethylubiquinone-9 3-methyltransferase (glyoxalase superfamily)